MGEVILRVCWLGVSLDDSPEGGVAGVADPWLVWPESFLAGDAKL
jgi:hypothetical protein